MSADLPTRTCAPPSSRLAARHPQESSATWLDRTLETTAELDYAEALNWFGLRLAPRPEPPAGWGLRSTDRQRTIVSEVRRGSPAFAAAVSVGDPITAIGGVPVRPGDLAARVEELAPGARMTLSLRRGDAAIDVTIALGSDPGHPWWLGVAPTPDPVSKPKRLAAWLGGGSSPRHP